MKQNRQYPKVMISPKAERSVKNGHPWIYGEEIRKTEGVPENGGLVDVFAGNAFMGTGFYNNASKITVRLISRNANDVFDVHSLSKNRHAWYRLCLLPSDS
jgi:23S rRNA (cytosine1962-C5)-methyltransferase